MSVTVTTAQPDQVIAALRHVVQTKLNGMLDKQRKTYAENR